MDALMGAVFELATQVSPGKLNALASKISANHKSFSGVPVSWLGNTPTATALLNDLNREWKLSAVSPPELAGLIRGAGFTHSAVKKDVETEFIWTGPTTPIVSTRRTDQALLEVINSAKSSLFLTSFVAYQVPSIISAIKNVIQRGVTTSILLESSRKHGGTISIDAIGAIQELLPDVIIYHWGHKSAEFKDAKVHAKIAVADQSMCFISSANLTGHAMDKNMEAGVIVKGGDLPRKIHHHLDALATINIISKI